MATNPLIGFLRQLVRASSNGLAVAGYPSTSTGVYPPDDVGSAAIFDEIPPEHRRVVASPKADGPEEGAAL